MEEEMIMDTAEDSAPRARRVGSKQLKNRDIRSSHFEQNDFNISYSDSSDPFAETLKEIEEPGMQYHFASSDDHRINGLCRRGWEILDPKDFSAKKFYLADKQARENASYLQVGGAIVMQRDERYQEGEDRWLKQERGKRYHAALSRETGIYKRTAEDIRSYSNPFANP